jgi:hypothetical protein
VLARLERDLVLARLERDLVLARLERDLVLARLERDLVLARLAPTNPPPIRSANRQNACQADSFVVFRLTGSERMAWRFVLDFGLMSCQSVTWEQRKANQMSKDKVELALWRSGLLRANLRGRGGFSAACAVVSRHAARLDRINMEGCNGVPKVWIPARQEWEMGLDDSDTARHEKHTAESRAAIRAALAPYLTPGCVWHWKTDARAGCAVRISDKGNRRDVFI